MTITQLDAKYMTVGELFNAVGRILERQGPDLRTNITGVKVSESINAARYLNAETASLVRDICNEPAEQGHCGCGACHE